MTLQSSKSFVYKCLISKEQKDVGISLQTRTCTKKGEKGEEQRLLRQIWLRTELNKTPEVEGVNYKTG